MPETIMPFGKYKGCRLSEIPDDYLDWLTSGAIDLRPWLKRAVEGEIDTRRKPPRATYFGPDLPPFVDKVLVQRLIKAGYRSLANKLHPDHGGSNEEMLLLNLHNEWLESFLDRVMAKRG